MEAIPISGTSANAIARALVHNYISRFDVPQFITSVGEVFFIGII